MFKPSKEERLALLNVIEDSAKSKSKLADVESMYEILFHNLPVAVIIVDSDGRIQKWNQRFQQLTQRPGNMNQIMIQEFIADNVRSAFRKQFKSMLSSGHITALESALKVSHHRDIPVEISMAGFVDSRTHKFYQLVITDLTQQKEVEHLKEIARLEKILRTEAIKIPEEYLSDTFNIFEYYTHLIEQFIHHSQVDWMEFIIPDLFEPNSVHTIFARREGLNRIKCRNRDLSGLDFDRIRELHTGTDVGRLAAPLEDILAEHNILSTKADKFSEAWVIPFTIQDFQWGFLITSIPDHWLGADLCQIFSDALHFGLQRVKDWNELIESRQEVDRLAIFPQENPSPVVELNAKGVVTFYNRAAENLVSSLGYNDIREILPNTYINDIKKSFSLDKKIPDHEMDLGDRSILWVGHKIEKLGLFHYYATDITALKQTEKELLKAKDQAVSSERLKDSFLRTISHEVRTPLNIILGYLEILKSELKIDPSDETLRFFEGITENGKRLNRLINDIIDISLIESGQLELESEPVPCDAIIHDLLPKFHQLAAEKGLELEANLQAEDVFIQGDSGRIGQVFSYIIDNAIKFTKKGTIRVDSRVENSSIIIRVKDTGIGIKDDFLPYLFALFRQQDEGLNRSYEGAGIGLALCERLVSAMHGTITVNSRVQRGSTFTVTFPVRKKKNGGKNE